MPGSSRREGGVGPDQTAARPGAGAGRGSDQGIVLLSPDGRGRRVVAHLTIDWASSLPATNAKRLRKGTKRRSNPSIPARRGGLLRLARNDDREISSR